MVQCLKQDEIPADPSGMNEGGGIGPLFRALSHPTLLRTCRSCGTQWKVPRYYARPRAKRLGSVRGIGGTGDGLDPLGRDKTMMSENESDLDGVAQYSYCPNCRSKDFSQKRIWHMSRADIDLDTDD